MGETKNFFIRVEEETRKRLNVYKVHWGLKSQDEAINKLLRDKQTLVNLQKEKKK